MIPIKDNIPTLRRPYLTIGLIITNVLIYLYQFALGESGRDFVFQFGAIPYEITHFAEVTPALAAPIALTVFSSMFLHGGWFHLGSNMLYLWIFGNNIEDRLGPVRFLIFYLASGVVAVLTFVVTSPNTKVPLVGASGAVAGLLGAYIIAYPRARVLTLIWVFYFVRLVWLPAAFFLGFWFILQLISGLPTLAGAGSSGIAYFAHIGGFVFGLLVCRFTRMRYGGRSR
jgi:membrane associated rhomboid family serine protease